MELLKLLNTSEIAAQIISFLLLLVILRIFFWKKLFKSLDARKERIAAEFQAIENTKSEVSKLKTEYETKLNSIENEARLKMREAIDEAGKISQELNKNARLDAEKIIENAKRDIKYEILKAKEELKERIVNLTIAAAENLIQEKLTEKRDTQIVRDFLEKIDEVDCCEGENYSRQIR